MVEKVVILPILIGFGIKDFQDNFMKYIFSFCFLIFFLSTNLLFSQVVHDLSSNSFVREFFISGPYKSKMNNKIDPVDMLEIEYIQNENLFNSNGQFINGQVIKSENGEHNINTVLDDTSFSVAYLFFQIKSVTIQESHFLLSVTDGAKLYVNGVQSNAFYGNNYNTNERQIIVTLKKGINNVIIKIPNKDWDWKIKLKILDQDEGENYTNEKNEKNEYFQFLNLKLQSAIGSQYSLPYTKFKVGSFPKLFLDRSGIAKKYLGGGYKIQVRWFDSDLSEVQYPKNPGRYGYYAEIIGNNGKKLKRSGTLFCEPSDWMAWNNKLYSDLDYFPVNNIPKTVWLEHRDAIRSYLGHSTHKSLLSQEKDIILLTFLDEMHKKGFSKDRKLTPLIYDGDYHALLKQKILGKENFYPKLVLPQKTKLKSTKLKSKIKKYKKQNPDFSKKMRKLCQDWIADGGSPFDMVIAKDGEIIFHEAFGNDAYGKFTINSPTEIASITKLFTGILFALFIDQNIIAIDDPVGKYLPDFPIEGPRAITMRQCFTHTSGLSGHGLFDGVHNHWLENTLYQIVKNDTVGTIHIYNGMGYDLVGKVMESVTGKSIFRLFHEYLYEPLGMKNTIHDWDLGYSVHTTAYDLAILAQMILNKGTYDDKRYFSEKTYEQILPKNLTDYYPNLRFTNPWDEGRPKGIGTTVQEWEILDEETGEKRHLLSMNVIGHGSATSSVFRIDLDNKIIITQSRRKGSSRFGDHFLKVYKLIDKQLVVNDT